MLRDWRTRRSHKVLVTGATGFIGSHVVKVLQEQGHQVRGTTRNLQNEDKVKPLYSLCPGSKYKLELVEADLLNPESWDAAVKGMEYVIHVASPSPSFRPEDENDLIKPAVEGTLNVFRACAEAKTVKRIVLTSSVAAIAYENVKEFRDKIRTEQDWSDPSKLFAYEKSKTLAERAAWDFIEELPSGRKMELAVINPGYVLGPVLHGNTGSSQVIIKRLLERTVPAVPNLNYPIADVRDVAEAHVKAMTLPEAAGNRHIIATDNMWVEEIARVLKFEFNPQGYSIPTTVAPRFFVWLLSLSDRSVKRILPDVDRVYHFDNSRMINVLGIRPHLTDESVIDTAYSMIELRLVFKSKYYLGRPSERPACSSCT